MNRIVRERYPVSKLPEDLREGFVQDRPVSIVIVQGEPDTNVDAHESGDPEANQIEGGDFAQFRHLRRANYASSAEVDAYIDALRNEWVHRER